MKRASFTASLPGAWLQPRWKPSLRKWAGIWPRSLLIGKGRKLQPYSVAPWAEERTDPALPPILKALRGDFFCLPFGGNATPFGKERHPVHGETANARWQFRSLETGAGRTCLHLSLATKVRPGRVDKRIWLLEGQNTIYCQHVVSEMEGPMNLGHHAMLKFPDEPGSGLMSTSRFVYAQVFPGAFELPEKPRLLPAEAGGGVQVPGKGPHDYRRDRRPDSLSQPGAASRTWSCS